MHIVHCHLSYRCCCTYTANHPLPTSTAYIHCPHTLPRILCLGAPPALPPSLIRAAQLVAGLKAREVDISVPLMWTPCTPRSETMAGTAVLCSPCCTVLTMLYYTHHTVLYSLYAHTIQPDCVHRSCSHLESGQHSGGGMDPDGEPRRGEWRGSG
jgi:hypothetical protein